MAQIALILSLTTENTHSTLRVPSGQGFAPLDSARGKQGRQRPQRGSSTDGPFDFAQGKHRFTRILAAFGGKNRSAVSDDAGRDGDYSERIEHHKDTKARRERRTEVLRLASCARRTAVSFRGPMGIGPKNLLFQDRRRRICFSRQRHKQTLRGVHPERSRRALSDAARPGAFLGILCQAYRSVIQTCPERQPKGRSEAK